MAGNKKTIFLLAAGYIALLAVYSVYFFYRKEKNVLLFWGISFAINIFYFLINYKKGFKTIRITVSETVFFNFALLSFFRLLFYRFFRLSNLLAHSGLQMLFFYRFVVLETFFAGNWLLPILVKLWQIMNAVTNRR
ncbi:MAG: hypothetical protein LBJ31_07005 [Treponema sp.]|jgi:hypothetical protein|nr:hypothetical protein [Treponema sp.]